VTISRETLTREAEASGFRAEILEKVFHALGLLEALFSHPYVKDRLVLKGGTALNLFLFDVPRLSVDLDLNYIGAVERDRMLLERQEVERAIKAVCNREGHEVAYVPTEHAGGKWTLRYASALGGYGNLAVDVNYMYRVPLWSPQRIASKAIGPFQAKAIPVLDVHELAAGKLAALMARGASRDLYDVHTLLKKATLDAERLRLAFVVYGAMNRKDWRTVALSDIAYEPDELASELLPLLCLHGPLAEDRGRVWADRLIKECREALSIVLPLTPDEKRFLDTLLDEGRAEPQLLTTDQALAERISMHPGLSWKAKNVREHRGR
jgi:predicted nucleotidyltransferase component of viral defense system